MCNYQKTPCVGFIGHFNHGAHSQNLAAAEVLAFFRRSESREESDLN